uniref:Uncharacterized protein n=1 Tax=Setaria viridis TaxID=4556 RepID=A0A4U6V3K8_SETVI|nr:LOW QUALITY PROTEIN: hypothetical protein SEVIR_4G162100v2 [Setaria viridis]
MTRPAHQPIAHAPCFTTAAAEHAFASTPGSVAASASPVTQMAAQGSSTPSIETQYPFDEGARFVEATADVTLDSVMTPLQPAPELLRLHPSGDGHTRFACGSLVVGFTAHHVVADSRATSNFFVSWSQATRGVPVDPAPVRDRAPPSSGPATRPLVEFDHRHLEFKPRTDVGGIHAGDEEVAMHKVHMSREFISKIKAKASPHGAVPGGPPLPVHDDGPRAGRAPGTTLLMAVDGRARMDPQVPDGYTGNVVLWARPTATAGDLVTKPLRHAVELVHRVVNRVEDEDAYFKSFIDFASSGAVEEERLVPTADAEEIGDDPEHRAGSFWELDFGGGQPFFFMPSYLPAKGLLILLSSFYGDGSVDAYVGLYSRDMDTFKSCCYYMDDD